MESGLGLLLSVGVLLMMIDYCFVWYGRKCEFGDFLNIDYVGIICYNDCF